MIDRVALAKAAVQKLQILWLEANENERELISAEISELTSRGAFSSLSERVLEEMREASDG